jgi:hypothetical protein
MICRASMPLSGAVVEPSRTMHSASSALIPMPPQSRLSLVRVPIWLRQLTSIGILVTVSAQDSETLANDINASFRSPNIAIEEKIKIWIFEQSRELLCYEVPDIDIRLLDFRNDLWPTIDDQKNVLQIAASERIAPAATEIGFELRSYEQFWRKALYVECVCQLASDGSFDPFRIPAIAEA